MYACIARCESHNISLTAWTLRSSVAQLTPRRTEQTRGSQIQADLKGARQQCACTDLGRHAPAATVQELLTGGERIALAE